MPRKRILLAAERQSVTKRCRKPACCKAATRLCPVARSVIAAPCKANGAHNSVGDRSRAPIVKSRSRTVFSSRATACGVVHAGSRADLAIGSADGEFGKLPGNQSGHVARRGGRKG